MEYQRETSKIKILAHIIQNYFLKDCGMSNPINFATKQPNVFYKGSHGGLGGCNIDKDSKLKLGTIQTNPKCRISLQQRPFLTVSFLGRGPSRPIVESRLMQGRIYRR